KSEGSPQGFRENVHNNARPGSIRFCPSESGRLRRSPRLYAPFDKMALDPICAGKPTGGQEARKKSRVSLKSSHLLPGTTNHRLRTEIPPARSICPPEHILATIRIGYAGKIPARQNIHPNSKRN